jgi:hypothetical protein
VETITQQIGGSINEVSTLNEQTLTPEIFLNQVEKALSQSTQQERDRLLEHARAWAVVFYDGEVLPAIEHRMESLEARWQSPMK